MERQADAFLAAAAALIHPSSNDAIRQATAKIEAFRKSPEACSVLLHMLKMNLSTGELILISQSLKWVCSHCRVDDMNIFELANILQSIPTALPKQISCNLFASFAIMIIRHRIVSLDPQCSGMNIIDSMLQSFSSHLPLNVLASVVQTVPEVCCRTTFFRGKKESVKANQISLESSVLSEVQVVLELLDKYICELVQQYSCDGIENLVDNLLNSTTDGACIGPVMSILTAAQLWLDYLSKFSTEHSIFPAYDEECWLHSRVLSLVATLYKKVLGFVEASMSVIVDTKLSNLLCLCGEVVSSLLAVKWSREDLGRHILTTCLEMHTQVLRTCSTIYHKSNFNIASISNPKLNMCDSITEAASSSGEICTLTICSGIVTSQAIVDVYRLHHSDTLLMTAMYELFTQSVKLADALHATRNEWYLAVHTCNPSHHEMYYALSAISVRSGTIWLAFWHNVLEIVQSLNTDYSSLYSNVFPGIIRGIILQCGIVDCPEFVAARAGIGNGHDFLWTDIQDEELYMLRKDTRDFLRLASSRVSDLHDSTHLELPVIQWFLPVVINELDQLSGMINVAPQDVAVFCQRTIVLESLLHGTAAMFFSEIITHLVSCASIGKCPDIIMTFMEALFVYTEKIFDSGCSLLSSSACRVFMRMSVQLVVDLYPVIVAEHITTATQKSVEIVTYWTNKCFCYFTVSLNLPEVMDWRMLSETELALCVSVVPFRLKQDHIGTVALLKMVQCIRKLFLDSEFWCTMLKFSLGDHLQSWISCLDSSINLISSERCEIPSLRQVWEGVWALILSYRCDFSSPGNDKDNRGTTWKSALIAYEAACSLTVLSAQISTRNEMKNGPINSCGLLYGSSVLPAVVIALHSILEHCAVDSGYSFVLIENILEQFMRPCGCLSDDQKNNLKYRHLTLYQALHSRGRFLLPQQYAYDLLANTQKYLFPSSKIESASLAWKHELSAVLICIHACILPTVDSILQLDNCQSNSVLMCVCNVWSSCCIPFPKLTPGSRSYHLVRDCVTSQHPSLTRCSYRITVQLLAENGRSIITALSSLLIKRLGGVRNMYSTEEFDVIQCGFNCLSTVVSHIKDWGYFVPIDDVFQAVICNMFSFEGKKQLGDFFSSIVIVLSCCLGYLQRYSLIDSRTDVNYPTSSSVDFINLMHDKDLLLSPDILKLLKCDCEPAGDPEILTDICTSEWDRVLIDCVIKSLRSHICPALIKEQYIRLLAKSFLILGTDRSEVLLKESFGQSGKCCKSTEKNLADHAKTGNWKKFKNVLKQV